jgi:hypothetical protein
VCAQIVFDPPSNTLQPPLGEIANVNAVVRTKTGETVQGNFVNAHAFAGGSISPGGGQSNTSVPIHFTYTAPNQKNAKAGFTVAAVSRAGTAEAQWDTGLGTGWSGQITYSKVYTGDQGHSELQEWTNSAAESVTVDVKNGVGTYSGHVEHKYQGENRQGVAVGNGRVTYRQESSDSMEGTGDGSFPAAVTVNIDEAHGTYSITIGQQTNARGLPISPWGPIGKEHWTRCYRADCKSGENDIGMPAIELSGPLGGKLQDRNHIQASYTERKEELGRAKNGVMVRTTNVTLARSGTTNRSSASK